MHKVSKSSDTKAVILEFFSDIRKYREEQRQKFQNMQQVENQKLVRKAEESQRNLEQLIQKNNESLNKTASCDKLSEEFSAESIITEDSTVTGHILNCFSDSSLNSPILSRNEEKFDKPSLTSNKPKKPFLRKGTGLLRYMPKKRKQLESQKLVAASEASKDQISYSQFETNLKSKSSISIEEEIHNQRGSSKSKGSRVHFKEPEIYIFKKDSIHESGLSHFSNDFHEQFSSAIEVSIPSETDIESDGCLNNKTGNENFIQNDSSISDIPNQEIEKNELAEFELLENCAQNSSFNSDSSVVQRVLKGEPVIPPKFKQFKSHYIENEKQRLCTKFIPEETKSPKSFLRDFKKEIHMKEQQIENIIQDIDPRINNLQKEISRPYDVLSSDTGNKSDDRCSTPLDLKMSQNYLTLASDCDSGTESPTNSSTVSIAKKHDINGLIPDCAGDTSVNEFKQYANLLGEETTTSSAEKSLLTEKIKELEDEIEIYRKHNQSLSVLCKERDEVTRKLKREYDGLEKYKEEQKKKLDEELENGRRELKREKDTFSRFQKLHKDNPTRKEREEITSLRQENEKLQGELKKQKIKATNDIKRMKNQLIAAEKERDFLKLENLKLEEQVQDLLQAIKMVNSKKKKSLTTSTKCDCSKKLSQEVCNPEEVLKSDNQFSIEEFSISKDDSNSEQNISPSTKSKVRFDPVPQYEKSLSENVSSEKLASPLLCESPNILNEDFEIGRKNFPESDNLLIGRTNLTDNVLANYSPIKETNLSNPKIHIEDDGTIVTMYSNGDIKKRHPNKHEIYTYVDETTEETFPCGLKIINFPDGKKIRQFSDCFSEVNHPDGTVQFKHIDKSEEIFFKNGTNVVRIPELIEIIKFSNGEKEIRLATLIRKIFANGTVRIVYQNGMMATRYPNGRIRIKDKNGKLVIDATNDMIIGF